MKESVGNVYCGIQPYEKAIDYYEEALHVVQEGEDKDGERKLQKRLGDACCNIHQFGKTADELYNDIRKAQKWPAPGIGPSADPLQHIHYQSSSSPAQLIYANNSALGYSNKDPT